MTGAQGGASTIQPGEVIGKYEILEVLGQGAMARVYKVRHRGLNAFYALKVLQVARGTLPERLLREGEVQASLNHRNVVRVTDTLVVDGMPGLVLEYIDGSDLDAYLEERGALPLDEVRSIGSGVIRGVRAAHRAGQLHRDLKPANVMLTLEDDVWVPKVADFGLTKRTDDHTLGSSGSTRTGQIMGSPAYMSPEQARDSKNVDERTDVFSLGCILYELATGVRAFEGPDFVSTMTRIAAGAFTPVDQLRPDLPEHLVSAVHGCLVVDRDARIPDCDTLYEIWTGKKDFIVPRRDAAATFQSLLGAGPHDPLQSLLSYDREPPPPTRRPRWPLGLALFGGIALASLFSLLAGTGVGYFVTQSGESLSPVLSEREPEVHEPEVPEPEVHEPEVDEPEVQAEPKVDEPDVQAEPKVRRTVVPPPRTRARPRRARPATPVPAAPAAPVSGTVVVGGAAAQVHLMRAGQRHAPGRVPVGLYTVLARFGSETEATEQGVTIRVKADQTTVLNCDALSYRCVIR